MVIHAHWENSDEVKRKPREKGEGMSVLQQEDTFGTLDVMESIKIANETFICAQQGNRSGECLHAVA